MKWIDKLKNLRFSDSDPHQQKTLSHVLLFFFVMVLLTLISRGAAGSNTARVTLITPSSQELKQTVQFYGTASPLPNVFAPVTGGLTISKVNKQPLDEVKEGDAIAEADQAALDELITRRRAALRQMELSLESQLKWSGISTRGVDDAEKALAKVQEAFDKIKSDSDVSAEEKVAARDKVTEAQKALDEAVAEYNEEVLQKYPSARTLMLDIAAAQAVVDALIQVQAQQYQILAPANGLLANQPLTEGSVTTGTEVIGISTPGNGFTLTFQTTPEEANDILSYGTELTATQEELKEVLRSYNLDLDTLGKEYRTFTAKLRETAWTDKSIAITGDVWASNHDVCVPMSALRQDSDGYFVYVMETTQTLMGIDKRAVRRDVFIENTDGRYAAVSGNISSNDQVILSSSKPLSDGDSVRVGP